MEEESKQQRAFQRSGSAMADDDGIAASGHRSVTGMGSSIFRFNHVNFVVGKKNEEKYILRDVSGTCKWGRVLAVMGPSGAGKTTLINALTLDALYGRPSGQVTLNGMPFTSRMFKSHSYVVKQHDKHWPFLTCRETLLFAAELYAVADTKQLMDILVQEIIVKMGLTGCIDTRNASLSGGQRRRLSIAIALLKQPTLLFLDEPTTGLDAAAASNIMQEIVRVAKEERIIIVCTIHQPSTKVYQGFDQLMIMSRGRIAFSGDVDDAVPYFQSIGYACPDAMNPAEFYLDLVNSDFSDESAVTSILDKWEEKKPGAMGASFHGQIPSGDEDGQNEVIDIQGAGFVQQLSIMMRRHFLMVVRDPVLYTGRCAIFLFANLVFAFVYWKARSDGQNQALNKMWVGIWFIGVPANMAVVAVYALNEEFKSILGETKNGMVSGVSYLLTKSIIVFPILFVFAISALLFPLFVIQEAPWEAAVFVGLLFAATMFMFESLAECLSVWIEDPILGMLMFMNVWFASFLFGGFLIPLRDLYWPFTLFYYIMPFNYYVRSSTHEVFAATTFEPCFDPLTSAVCVPSSSGTDVLNALNRVMPLLSGDSRTAQDIFILFAIGLFYKMMYVIGVFYKASQYTKFVNE